MLSNQTKQTFSIITNDAIIAISQDSNGSPANRVWRHPLPGAEFTYSTAAGTPSIQLWSGYLSGWATVVALLNTGDVSVTQDVLFSDVFVDQARPTRFLPLIPCSHANRKDSENVTTGRCESKSKLPSVRPLAEIQDPW